jgi:hypothetical protein
MQQFLKHEIVNNDYSVIGFFKHHYIDKTYDSDYEQDMKLPFKTYDFTAASASLIFTIQESKNYLPQKPKKYLKKEILISFIKRFYFRISNINISTTRSLRLNHSNFCQKSFCQNTIYLILNLKKK